MQQRPAAIGRYRVGARLDATGDVPVLLGHDPMLHRDVALVLVPPPLGADPAVRARLRRGAEALAAVHHPHLATMLDVVEDERTVALVVERVDGASLSDIGRRRGPLALASVLAIAEHVAGALDAMHRRGIVHRQVSAGRVIIAARDGGAVLLPPSPEFDLLPRRQSIPPIGRATLVTPEERSGGRLSARTDVYQLAAIIAIALAGQPLPDGDAARALAALRPDLPPALLATVGEALARDPDHRPAGPLEFVARLRAAAGIDAPVNPAALPSAVPDDPGPAWGPAVAPSALSAQAPTSAATTGERMAVSPPGSHSAAPPAFLPTTGGRSGDTVLLPRAVGRPRRRGWPLWAAGTAALILAGSAGFVIARHTTGGSPPLAAVAPPNTGAAVPAAASPAVRSSATATPAPSRTAAASPTRPAAPPGAPAPVRTPPAVAAPVRTPSSEGGEGTTTPAPRTVAPRTLLLSDDFEAPERSVLPTVSPDPTKWTFGVEQGEYVIRKVDGAYDRLPSAYLPAGYDNAALAINVRLIGTDEGRLIAVGCRASEQGAYRLTINIERRGLLLSRWDGGTETQLAGGWTPAPTLRDPELGNTVEFACAGQTLTATINGAVVATAVDSAYTSGRWWIGAGVFSDRLPASVEARFDHLRLYRQ